MPEIGTPIPFDLVSLGYDRLEELILQKIERENLDALVKAIRAPSALPTLDLSGDVVRALFERAISLAPKDADLYERYGFFLAFRFSGSWEKEKEAAAMYEQAAALHEESAKWDKERAAELIAVVQSYPAFQSNDSGP